MQIVRLDYIQHGDEDPAIKEYYVGPSFLGEMPSRQSLDIFRGVLRCTEATAVFDWWLGLVHDGHPPEKSRLLFREMARFSHDLGLVVCMPDRTAQVRLAGGGVEELVGRSLKGMDIKKATPFSAGLCALSWQSQIEERRVRYYRRDLRHFGRGYRDVGILELPVENSDESDIKYVLSHIKAVDRRYRDSAAK